MTVLINMQESKTKAKGCANAWPYAFCIREFFTDYNEEGKCAALLCFTN